MTTLDSPIRDQQFDSYVAALRDSDRRRALTVARSLLADGVPAASVLLDLVCAAQGEVGRLWETGAWNVAQEHVATAISEAVVTEVALAVEPEQRADSRHIVVACVENEWHALPARVVAEVLALSGHAVTFLGASTPPPQLAQYVHDTGPDAVALSCSLASALPRARRMIEAAREAGVPVLAGGSGFGPDDLRARRLGAAAWAPTVHDALALLVDWRATATPAPPLRHEGADEQAELVLREEDLARFAGRELESSGHGEEDDVAESARHVVRFLGAALLVDDPRIIDEHIAWRRRVDGAQGRASVRLDAELSVLLRGIADLPAAEQLLLAAAAAR
ncbi:MAG: cobalamin B12-binding domain-containing protein [Actinomycetales bacterium]